MLRLQTKAYGLVAEHIMGWQRKPHQGTIGGGTVGTRGSETWLHCHWCHQRITSERIGEPCPAYRFPDITLLALLMRLGELDVQAMVRSDPLRSQNRFTVLLHGLRLPDTDAPLTLLIEVLGAVLARDPLAPLSTHLAQLRAEVERGSQSWSELLDVDLSIVEDPLCKTHTTAPVFLSANVQTTPNLVYPSSHSSNTSGWLQSSSSGDGAPPRYSSSTTTDVGACTEESR